MNRSERRFRLRAYGRIVTDKSVHFRCGGNEVYGNAPAHAVATHRNPILVDVGLLDQKAPALGQYTGKLWIGCFCLDLRSGNNMRRLGISQLFEDVDRKSRVAQLGKFSRLGFDILAEPSLGMDLVERRTGLRAFRSRQESRDAVLLGRK